MNEVVVKNESGYLSANQVVAQANLIQQVMKAVMEDGVHFGKVPGCGDKPTLLKPGAEKILSTFRISVQPIVQDLSSPDLVKYRVTARGISSGVIVGEGLGTCSSDEEKYKFRKAIGKEFSETPEDRRRLKWRRGWSGGPDKQEEQVRTSPADLDNTILKMAKKRAMVDLCLTATAASDCFNQDVEDLPAEYIGEDVPAVEVNHEMPQRKTAPVAAPVSINSEADDIEPPEQSQLPTLTADFKQITAKYKGVCKGCNGAIEPGTEIFYSKTKGNFHPLCLK